jgi:CarD family transcriptional regulator
MKDKEGFKIGEKAVYPAHGVGKIEDITTKEIAGKKISFYILKILDSDMTILVPTHNTENVGLRKIISNGDVLKVYKILKDKKLSVDIQTWNRRYREYMKKIKTGSIFEIAEVLRDLSLLKLDKTLSFGERKMFDTARYLLKKELSIAQSIKEEEIEKEFKKIFNN